MQRLEDCMGAWGTQILEDDVAADVYADFMQRYEDGLTPAAIRRELEDEYSDYLEDEDDMPLFWFAMTQAQWEIAQLQPSVLAKVSALIAAGRGLERWREAGEEALHERQWVLAQFLTQLQEANSAPHKRGHKTPET